MADYDIYSNVKPVAGTAAEVVMDGATYTPAIDTFDWKSCIFMASIHALAAAPTLKPDGSADVSGAKVISLPNAQWTTLDASVKALLCPPMLVMRDGCSSGPTFFDPLNIRCSKRCAKPVRPGRSFFDPT